MRDQDLRAFFTEAAACGCAQICLAAEANQFQNTMAVLAVNRLLFERWKAANVDEKGETQAWREAIAYCRAQQEKGLVPRAIAEANCTIRLTVPHDDIDLRDALKQACVSGEDLARLKKLIMDCVGPVDALVGAFVLQRKFDAAASAAGCK